jgi:hypothetical protein
MHKLRTPLARSCKFPYRVVLCEFQDTNRTDTNRVEITYRDYKTQVRAFTQLDSYRTARQTFSGILRTTYGSVFTGFQAAFGFDLTARNGLHNLLGLTTPVWSNWGKLLWKCG